MFVVSKFKDECDYCKQWKYGCKGYKGMLVCPDCIHLNGGKLEIEPIQTTLFDFIEGKEKEK